jgi:hypothetical protein
MPTRTTVLAVILLCGSLARPASAVSITTLDFEALSAADATIRSVGSAYSVDGYTFTASVPSSTGNTPNFNTIGARSSSYDGSTTLYNGNGLGGTTLSRSDGDLFRLFSIDLAEMPNFDPTGRPVNLGSFALTFVGTKGDGSTVQATATILPFSTSTTLGLPADFDNLLAVSWTQGRDGAPSLTHQFDNVRVTTVPEPATLFLLGMGLASVGLLRGRRAH